MRLTIALFLTATSLVLSGCEGQQRSCLGSGIAEVAQTDTAKKTVGSLSAPKEERRSTSAQNKAEPAQEVQIAQEVSLNQADAVRITFEALNRKIIRNANLTVEVASATESQHKVASIAESHDGFVVTSDATQRSTEDKTKPEITVSLVVRVPAAKFNQVVEEIRAVGSRVIQEKITGQDVTEEFIDLEARIRNQHALEAQFLEIMKRAGKVEDALEVQRELADVRTEIEKLEGRRRFIENQSSLSTIEVTLQPPTVIVSTTGFSYSVRSAFADGVETAAGILLFLIRAVVGLLPILIFIVLPAGLAARFFIRRKRRLQPVPRDAAA